MISGVLNSAGVSSSASVGIAYLKALAYCNGFELDAAQVVDLDRALENGYLGLRNGILDPASICYGKRNALAHINTVTGVVASLPKSHQLPFRILLVHRFVFLVFLI